LVGGTESVTEKTKMPRSKILREKARTVKRHRRVNGHKPAPFELRVNRKEDVKKRRYESLFSEKGKRVTNNARGRGGEKAEARKLEKRRETLEQKVLQRAGF